MVELHGGGGDWGAEGGLKHPFKLKEHYYAFSMRRKLIHAIHKGGQDCYQEQFDTPCSPINAPKDHEMRPRGLTASVKSCL